MNKTIRARLIGVGCVLTLLSSVSIMQAKSCCTYKLDTILQQMNQLSQNVAALQNKTGCSAIPLSSAGEINTSGNYCLTNDIVGSIVVNAPYTNIDLNGWSIISPDFTSAVLRSFGDSSETHGVLINADHVAVFNTSARGAIRNFPGSGIHINSASVVQIGEIKTSGNIRGISSSGASTVYVRGCVSDRDKTYGFLVDSGSGHVFFGCQAIDTGVGSCSASESDALPAHAFFATNSGGTVFEACKATGTTGQGKRVAASGFTLSNEFASKVFGCSASDVSSLGGPAYGVRVKSVPQSSLSPLIQFQRNGSAAINGIAWMPAYSSDPQDPLDPQYFVVAGAVDTAGAELYSLFMDSLSTLSIKKLVDLPDAVSECFCVAWNPADETMVSVGTIDAIHTYTITVVDTGLVVPTEINTITLEAGAQAKALSWSPDGKYLVAGLDSTTNPLVRVYDATAGFVYVTGAYTRPALSSASVASVAWSVSDLQEGSGNLIAVGISGAPAGEKAALLYVFSPSPVSLQEQTFVTRSDDFYAGQSVSWAPSAVGELLPTFGTHSSGTSPATLWPYEVYQGISSWQWQPADFVDHIVLPDTRAVAWAQYGEALAVVSNSVTEHGVYLRDPYDFSMTVSCGLSHVLTCLAWSIGDNYLAVADQSGIITIFEPFNHSLNCVVLNNQVSAVTAGSENFGVGVQANSVHNFVAKNTSLNNAIHYVGVSPDLVTNQPNALVAGNVYQGVGRKKWEPYTVMNNETKASVIVTFGGSGENLKKHTLKKNDALCGEIPALSDFDPQHPGAFLSDAYVKTHPNDFLIVWFGTAGDWDTAPLPKIYFDYDCAVYEYIWNSSPAQANKKTCKMCNNWAESNIKSTTSIVWTGNTYGGCA